MYPTPRAMKEMFRLATSASFPVFMKISYVTLTSGSGVLKIVNAGEDMTYNDEVYSAASFKYKPPKYSDNKMGDATFSIFADQSIIATIRDMTDRATATVVAAFDTTEIGITTIEGVEDFEFELEKATWDGLTITWNAIFDDDMNIVIPIDTATAFKVPGVA